jgi:hypothetical protein
MEEDVLDVELMDRPILGEGEGEDGADGGELDDGAGGLVIVHSRALGEAPKDPTGLVAVEGAVRSQIVAKEPLASDHISARRTRHQVAGVVGQQGRLILHSPTQVWVSQGGAYRGDRGGIRWSSSRIGDYNKPVDGQKDTSGLSRHHRVDVPGVAVNGDRLVHRRLRARCRGYWGRWRGRLAAVIDDGGRRIG